jgi:hypothetical protein
VDKGDDGGSSTMVEAVVMAWSAAPVPSQELVVLFLKKSLWSGVLASWHFFFPFTFHG